MHINQLIHILVLAAGLQAVGCAVDNPADEDTTSSATSELSGGVPTGVQCSDKAWRVDFLDDATHTTVVGTMSCTCWGPELLAGVTSNFSVLVREFVCDIN